MTALRNKNQDPIQTKAQLSLEIFEEIKNLSTQLENDKEFWRNHADGETVDIVVPNLGKIQIKKPSEASVSDSTTFDLKAFDALDKAVQHQLISSGVVKITRVSKAASKAAVVFTLNV